MGALRAADGRSGDAAEPPQRRRPPAGWALPPRATPRSGRPANPTMLRRIKMAAKLAISRTSYGRFIGYRYSYSFSPRQLSFLTVCIDRTAALTGGIAEIGCFLGYTSIFLNVHMNEERIEKPYYALDTFSGFVPEQLEYERAARGKAPVFALMRTAFTGNSQALFDRQLAWNGITRVRSIRADAAAFDYASIGPLSFALIDVDLYIPVLRALEKVVPLMQPGGMVVVDDCTPGQYYDGALQAYTEFTAGRGLPFKVVHKKLGLIEL